MIDYEKLREAHELILKAPEKYCVCTYVSCNYDPYHRLMALNSEWFEDYETIDDLILKLRKLTELEEPKAKYKVGSIVWRLNDEWQPQSMEICDIDLVSDEMYLDTEAGTWWMEEQLYPTKQALIDAQAKYWSDLAYEERCKPFEMYGPPDSSHIQEKFCTPVKECQHESDGNTYYKNGIKCTDFLTYACSDSPCVLKCKKCGEFYR